MSFLTFICCQLIQWIYIQYETSNYTIEFCLQNMKLQITQRWHPVCTSGNKKITNGITVKNLDYNTSEQERKHVEKWDIKDNIIKGFSPGYIKKYLNITNEDYKNLIDELDQLEKQQQA